MVIDHLRSLLLFFLLVPTSADVAELKLVFFRYM